MGIQMGLPVFYLRNPVVSGSVFSFKWSGDGLYATTTGRGSMNSAFLENALTGHHNGSALRFSAMDICRFCVSAFPLLAVKT
jgi:hypothetical protein